LKILKRKNKFYDTERFGQPEIRVLHRKGHGKRSPGYLIAADIPGRYAEVGIRHISYYMFIMTKAAGN
jgi:hypothetical protein